jgi:transposase
MTHFIGMDVHAASTTIVVVSDKGRCVDETVVATRGEVLVKALQEVRRPRHVVFEEGCQSEWLYELLERHADSIVVAQPSGRDGSKSDARDALGLATKLRLGQLSKRVFKQPQTFRALKQAVRAHRYLTRDLTRAKNRLCAQLRAQGVEGVREELYDAETRKTAIAPLNEAVRGTAELLGEAHDALAELQARAEKRLVALVGVTKEARLLTTVPGIGAIRAATIAAVVMTPERFASKRQFWSYCGLGVVTESSADWKQQQDQQWVRTKNIKTKGLNRNRNPWLKDAFKGAAETIIMQAGDEPLHQHYQRLLKAGTKPNLAALTIARQIASIVLAVWRKKEAYDPQKLKNDEATT